MRKLFNKENFEKAKTLFIIIVLVGTVGVISGWNLRGDMNQRIDNEVAKKFEQSKTNQ